MHHSRRIYNMLCSNSGPHCSRRGLTWRLHVLPLFPKEVRCFGGLNSIAIRDRYRYIILYCMWCEYSEYMILYYNTTDISYISDIFVYGILHSPYTPPPNTNTHTLLGRNDFWFLIFFSDPLFSHCSEINDSYTIYTRETHRVGPAHRAEIR